MASLAFNALSLSPKPITLPPTRYKSQNYAVTVRRTPLSSNARFHLNAVPQAYALLSTKGRGFKTLWCTSSSKGGDAEIESSAEQQLTEVVSAIPVVEVVSAIPVVKEFYEAINRRDLKALSDIMSDKCLYLSFPTAFEGKEAVLRYAKDMLEALGKDMLFTIDGINEGHDLIVTVLWHLEWRGKKLHFPKGCGIFYCEKEGDRLLIRTVHHFIESPPGELILKLGELIMRWLNTITSFYERLLKAITSFYQEVLPIAKKFLADRYYAFEGVLKYYRKYLRPLPWPIILPLVIYYRLLLVAFLYVANSVLQIVLRIVKILSFGKRQK